MQALILAGGLGTRLQAALPDLPKPMAPVNGHPFLEYLVRQVHDFGVQKILLCVGYKAEIIEEYFGHGKRFGVQIEYSREEDLLGTAGAIRLAEAKITFDDFLLINGDCFCEFDGRALLTKHQQKNAAATLVATNVEDRTRFGSLIINDRDEVLGFDEKGAARGAGWINAGIYALNKRILDLIPERTEYSLERQVFPHLCGGGLYAFKTRGVFIDIGLPEEWHRAESLLPELPESYEGHRGNDRQ